MPTIGRALMTNPDLILIDEATEGLLPWSPRRSGAPSRASAPRASRRSSSISDFRALSRLADWAMILSKGEIVFEGPPAELAAKREVLEKIRQMLSAHFPKGGGMRWHAPAETSGEGLQVSGVNLADSYPIMMISY